MNKILVCQVGARHRYLVPRIMHKAGILSHLYTDSCLYSLLGKIANIVRTLGCKKQNVCRLANRNPQIPREFVKSTDILLFNQIQNRKKDTYTRIHTTYHGLVKKFIKWNVENCNVVYNMYFENIDFLRFAKNKGKTIVVDIYENPTAYEEMIAEVSNVPEYNRYNSIKQQYTAENRLRKNYINELLGIADYYTIPSTFVLNSLKTYSNFEQSKVKILPYPSSITKKENNHRPVKHRIIWVGNDPVRKGLVYCAKAATILKRKYKDLDFRIIGVTDKDLMHNETFKNLNFVGILNKQQLIDEYETAEAYVFPTLYEGLAGTVIEAACCGCPIITTENAGVEKGQFPALYIPTRNVNSIVEAVEKIFNSPEIQRTLSKKIFDYANNEYSPERYEKDLLSFFNVC